MTPAKPTPRAQATPRAQPSSTVRPHPSVRPAPSAPPPAPARSTDTATAALRWVERAPGGRRAFESYHSVEHRLARWAPARVLLAVPRTVRFALSTVADRWREPVPGQPSPPLSPRLLAYVALDEATLAMAMSPSRYPRRADYERVGAELHQAQALFTARGWIDRPATYHRAPGAPESPVVTRGWALGASYERVSFDSGYAPHPDEPGAARWSTYVANRTASMVVLRHPGPPRPWVIGVHGFVCGFAFMDFIGLHALGLHRDLGVNVALPVLPLHGHRRASTISGERFLTFDLVDTLHGLAQSAWDVRRVLAWVQAQDAPRVALYGVSLGAYVSALVASLDRRVDAVVAGIPVSDLPALFRAHSPHHIQLRAVEHAILDGTAASVHRVVSPLALAPRVARPRRFLYAGLGDRLARPAQAVALWHHWDEPRLAWYEGSHVGYLWSAEVRRFLVTSLASAGIDGRAGAAGDGGRTVARRTP